MKKNFQCLFLFVFFAFPFICKAKTATDTIQVGMYITNLHDLDFKNQEYQVSFWFWVNLKSKGVRKSYRNAKIDLLKSLEIPEAIEQSFYYVDTTSYPNYILSKFMARIKDSLRITWFPFDHQHLHFSVESGLYDINKVIIQIDSNDILPVILESGGHLIGDGWRIESRQIGPKVSNYYTKFGVESLPDIQQYSAAAVAIEIHRRPWGIFFKLFIGMYISFFIAFVSFFIHFESIESRLSISVGALFAVIGNKYIVESILPETIEFNLVDWLHSLSLLCILIIIFFNTLSIKYVKRDEIARSIRLDNLAAIWIMSIYLFINLLLILIPNVFFK